MNRISMMACASFLISAFLLLGTARNDRDITIATTLSLIGLGFGSLSTACSMIETNDRSAAARHMDNRRK
jgi:hypothetical protein